MRIGLKADVQRLFLRCTTDSLVKNGQNNELTVQMFVENPAEMCTLAVACTVSTYVKTPTHFFTVIVQLCSLVILAEDVLGNLALQT